MDPHIEDFRQPSARVPSTIGFDRGAWWRAVARGGAAFAEGGDEERRRATEACAVLVVSRDGHAVELGQELQGSVQHILMISLC